MRNGLNFTLTTRLGDLDLLGEVVGGGGYRDLMAHTIEVEAFDVKFRCIDPEAAMTSCQTASGMMVVWYKS